MLAIVLAMKSILEKNLQRLISKKISKNTLKDILLWNNLLFYMLG